MKLEEFKEFFKTYSKNVDNADRLFFWKLSDAIIFEIIKQNLPPTLSASDVILDAGGGTGRWVVKLSKEFPCKFIIYDLSEDMLKQAKKNIKSAGLENIVQFIHGDLINMYQIGDASINHIISIYNPISFIYEKEKAIQELARVLTPGGRLIIMGQGYYNAIASKINNYLASSEEIRELEKTHKVKWAPHVPRLNVFSKEDLEGELQKVGLNVIKSYGVPVFAQPGPEDFDPENIQKSRISQALENQDFFQVVFEIEMEYNSRPELVNRGMNILVVAEK